MVTFCLWDDQSSVWIWAWEGVLKQSLPPGSLIIGVCALPPPPPVSGPKQLPNYACN